MLTYLIHVGFGDYPCTTKSEAKRRTGCVAVPDNFYLQTLLYMADFYFLKVLEKPNYLTCP